MNIEEYLKKENDYIEIENNLLSIKGAIEGALIYLESPNNKRMDLDLEEIIVYLNTVFEEIDDIRKIVNKLKIKINKLEGNLND